MKAFAQTKKSRRAFTLPEVMVVATLATLVLGGVIYAHMVGLRLFSYTQAKLGGNDDARNTAARLIDDIRSAKTVRVGNGSATSFTECATNSLQRGNALQLYPRRGSSNYIRYFQADDTLWRISPSNAPTAIAKYVTNRVVFNAEDFNGVTLTNNENNRVIGVNLQFYQVQYAGAKLGTNQFYDYYQVRTKVTRRTLE